MDQQLLEIIYLGKYLVCINKDDMIEKYYRPLVSPLDTNDDYIKEKKGLKNTFMVFNDLDDYRLHLFSLYEGFDWITVKVGKDFYLYIDNYHHLNFSINEFLDLPDNEKLEVWNKYLRFMKANGFESFIKTGKMSY